MRQKCFQLIHYILIKIKHLIYKSQRHTVKTLFKLQENYVVCNIPPNSDCKNSIGILCFYCIHLKPSVKPLLTKVECAVKKNA